MKQAALVLIGALSLTLTACGGGSDCTDSKILGTYTTSAGDTLVFGTNCVFTSAICGTGKFESAKDTAGTIGVEITAMTGPSNVCLPVGSYQCIYFTSGSSFTYSCVTN